MKKTMQPAQTRKKVSPFAASAATSAATVIFELKRRAIVGMQTGQRVTTK